MKEADHVPTRSICPLLAASLMLLPIAAQAESWAPTGCGNAPTPPKYTLNTREAYGDALKKVRAYQADAQLYSACVLKEAHAEQTHVSRAAQNRIAEINTVAVATQQEIYARMTAQATALKSAAARLTTR